MDGCYISYTNRQKLKYTGAMASTDTKSLSSLNEILNAPEDPPSQQANKF